MRGLTDFDTLGRSEKGPLSSRTPTTCSIGTHITATIDENLVHVGLFWNELNKMQTLLLLSVAFRGRLIPCHLIFVVMKF